MSNAVRSLLIKVGAISTLMFIGLTLAPSAQAESTLDKINRTGVFLAGVRYDFPPVGTVDDAGKPTGFGPALAKIFADKLGAKVQYVQVTSKSRIPLLQNGSIDADIGPTTPTVDRNKVVDFTIPYVWDGDSLIVYKGASLNIKDYAPPKKIATTQGSLFGTLVKELVPNAELVLFQEFPDTLVALINHKVDAVATNHFNAVTFVKKYPQLVVGNDYFQDPWAIGIRQDDTKWRNFLNFTMQEMWKSGEYQKLYAQYFGELPAFHMWSEFRLQPGIGGVD